MKSKKFLSTGIVGLLMISLMIPIVKAQDTSQTTTPEMNYSTYIQGQGWEKEFVHKSGEQAGTTGQAKAIEGIKIQAKNLPTGTQLKFRVHSRDIGWQNWLKNGEQAGVTGQGKPIEAIQIQLENAKDYIVEYKVHVSDIGWQDWVKDGDIAGTVGKVKSIEAIQIKITKRDASVVYKAYIQNSGWQNWKANGETAGTTGKAKSIYAFNIDTSNYGDLQLEYQAHVSDIGWMNWVDNGNEVGSNSKNKNIEALKIKVKNSNQYTISYRAHVSDIGWQNWVSDGNMIGTVGQVKAIEAIEIKISKRPATITYRAHVQDIGWQNWKNNGETAGTTGQAKSIEALYIDTINYDGLQLQYQAHAQDIGWMDWVTNNKQAGTTGQAKPMEAIKIKVANSDKYSVMYKVHVRDIGWMDWCYDGAQAGTTGQVKPIEAIQIKIVPKVNIVTEIGTYGKSGLVYKGDTRGSDLQYYRFGQGPNVLFATFAVHGFEDKWAGDGTELTLIANEFFERLKSSNNQDIANKWTVYIFPEVNTDGRRCGWTNNGPGRTTLFSQAPGNQGIDMNRCWQINGVPYTRYPDSRNYNGTAGFQAYEAQALRDFLVNKQSKTGQTILIDLHGWTNQLIGDTGICNTYYYPRFQNADRSSLGRYGTGYLVNWARSTLKSSTANARSALIELPSSGINGPQDVKNYNLPGRYIDSTMEMLRNISVLSKANYYRSANNSSKVAEIQEISQEEQYNIALAGMIKQDKPQETEIKELTQKGPQEKGIWVETSSRESVLQLINQNTNYTYEINNEGYLQIKESEKQTSENGQNMTNRLDTSNVQNIEKNTYDKLLEKMINGQKTYVISQTGQYYSKDYMTGTIENNPFENMDAYQTYEYVEANGKMAIILTKNKENKLTDKEILDSLNTII